MRRPIAWLVLACPLFFVAPATAQLIIVDQEPMRSRPNRFVYHLNQLNYDDCAEDGQLTFSANLTDATGLNLQVWAGEQCETEPARTDGTCWKVFEQGAGRRRQSVTVSARALLAGRTLVGASSPTEVSDPATLDECHDAVGAKRGTPLVVYFMLVQPADGRWLAYDSWSATYKLTSPRPPEQVAVHYATRDRAIVDFDYDATAPEDLFGFTVLCDPPNPLKSLGIEPIPVTDVVVYTSECREKSVLETDSLARTVSIGACGSVSATARSLEPWLFQGDIAYSFAVAAQDDYGNLGKPSRVVCEPRPIAETRVESCALMRRRPSPSFFWLATFVSCVLLARRRTRELCADTRRHAPATQNPSKTRAFTAQASYALRANRVHNPRGM